MASLSYRNLTLFGLGLIFWPAIAAHSAIVLTVKQVGSDVVVIGSGTANTTNGLATPISDNDYTNILTDTQIYAGPAAVSTDPNTPDVAVKLWGGLSGPSLIGNDPTIFETPIFGSGDLFGIVADNGQGLLVLPSSYMSGDSLSGTSRFSNFTLADLGLSPGVLSWTWGTNPNADSLELRIEPVPAPGPLPLAGGAMAWSLAKRMRRASRGQRLHDHSKNPTHD